jgi:hypothetical protein
MIMERSERSQLSRLGCPGLSRYNAAAMKGLPRPRAPARRAARERWIRFAILPPVLAGGLAVVAAPAPPAATHPAAAAEHLLWPLEIPGTLLSTFGEYRYDHLHAGIDISTGGATGYRVLAAAGGEIFRLKVEWRGYGRALYLRHADGRVTVYGHLERYEDAVLGLEKRVATRQREAKTRYPGDIYLEPPVRVRRGQLIAYSGESGVGLPHLHFEVRETADRPIDPFLAGLRAPADARPPVLESLTITAAGPESFVEGDRREATYPLTRRGGIFVAARPVRVRGPFIAAVSAYDPAGTEGRAGVHAVEASLDGARRYRLVFQGFRFDQYPQAGLVYDHRGSRLGPAHFLYRLLRFPGNALAAADDGGADAATTPGAFALEDGAHLLQIETADEAGNRSRARVCLLVASPPDVEVSPGGGAGGEVARFRIGAETAEGGRAASASGRDAAGACPAPPLAVEGEVWTGTDGRFLPLSCPIARGACFAAGSPAAPAGSSLVRLRALAGGVPGRWRIVGPGEVPSGPVPPGDATTEFWPGFAELVLRLARPAEPALAIAGSDGGPPLGAFAYRSGSETAAAIAYPALAGSSALVAAPPGRPEEAVARWSLQTRIATPGTAVTIASGDVTVAVPAGGRFFAGPLVVRRVEASAAPGLAPASEALDVLPEGEALDAAGTIRFGAPGPPEQLRPLGIYRWDAQRGRWGYEGGEPDPAGGGLFVRFRRYGRFALLRDVSPPEIREVRPAEGARGVERRPHITARVEDVGEGLDFDGVSFVLDGDVPLESEFDPDRGVSRVLDPPSLAPGLHRLVVRATDLAGNSSAPLEVTFEVR